MNHATPEPPEWMVCDACALPLNSFQPSDAGPTIYQHPLRPGTVYDHEPLPVPRDGDELVIMECDFCSDPDVAWIYPTSTPMGNMLAIETRRATEEDHDTMRDHTIRRHRTTGHEELRENRFSPDWAACDPCAKLIDRYDANALASRVAKLLPSHPPQNVLKKLYRDFLRKKQPKRPALPNP